MTAAQLAVLGENTCTDDGWASFNAQQYLVKHADPAEHLQVQAAAGSGKTHVMVQRVLFLLATVADLQPANIAMVTFTRDATLQMRDRLGRTLTNRFRLTREPRFLTWLLGLPALHLSTIHAFGRRILADTGAGLGLSPECSVRSYALARKQAMHDVITAQLTGNQVPVDHFNGTKLYDVEKFLEWM